MSARVLFVLVVVVTVILIALRELRITRELESLRTERDKLAAQQEEMRARSDELAATVQSLQTQVDSAGPVPFSGSAASAAARMAQLESQVHALSNLVVSRGFTGTVPAHDPMQPLPTEASSETQTNATPKRGWGPEQVLGPPDTDRAGDIPTAWATRDPDGGAEWLSLGFDRAVQLAEVRIRETFNPGAISKVITVVGGREIVLWEGTDSGGTAPRDFTVPVAGNVWSQNIIVHLDTTRVPGWNEIDAVEIIGSDGSRQWATSANASSTYAER